MWLKLLQNKSKIGEMIKPQFVNGHWRKPIISGQNKHELKGYFHQAGVPWIYEKPKPEINIDSVYNKKPKP